MFGCAGSSLLSGFFLVVASRSCSVAVVHSFSLWRCFLAWDMGSRARMLWWLQLAGSRAQAQ